MPVAEEKPPVRCAGCEALFDANQVVVLKGKSYCASCKEIVLDDLKAGVSSDGIELASIGARFVAQFIDVLIIGIPVGILAFALTLMNAKDGQSAFVAQIIQQFILSIPYLLYSGFVLTAMQGRTVGKKIMKLRVVQADGSEAASSHFWKREGMRFVFGLIPLVGLIDYLMAFGKGRRTLHDKIGGTIVVRAG